MSKKLFRNLVLATTLSSFAFTSCNRTMSPDDPFPPKYNPSLYFSSNNRNLFSYDVGSLQKNWEFVADDEVKASPTIYKDFVILVSKKGTIYKLNNITGELVQKITLNVPVVATPIVYNDKLIVCTADGRMIAYAGDDFGAAPYWTASGLGSIVSSPTVTKVGDSETIGVVGANIANEIFVINEADGSVIWKKAMTPAGSIVGSVTASPFVIFAASTNGKLYSVKTVDGNNIWNYTTGGPLTASPISIGGNVMVGSADMNFYSIDSMSGKVRWKVPAGDKVESSASYDDQFVYYGSNDQYIYCVDVIHGLLVWKKRTFGTVRSSAVVYNKKVYIGSFDKNLYILDATTGKEEKILSVTGQMDCSPLIDNINRIYYPPVSGNYFLK